MELYLILGAAIFAVSTAISFATKAVANNLFFAHLFLFPLVYLISGLPLGNIITHLMMAVAMLLVGFIAFNLKWCGGGVSRALILLGLWAPSWAFLGTSLTNTFIAGGICAVVVMLLKLSDRIEFAAIIFACCCALFAYQHQGLPDKIPVKTVTTEIANAPALTLRGLSQNPQKP